MASGQLHGAGFTRTGTAHGNAKPGARAANAVERPPRGSGTLHDERRSVEGCGRISGDKAGPTDRCARTDRRDILANRAAAAFSRFLPLQDGLFEACVVEPPIYLRSLESGVVGDQIPRDLTF